VQPLCEVLRRHTDGRGTNRAPNAWFQALLTCDLPLGLGLLAATLVEDSVRGWPIEDALADALAACYSKADPLLLLTVHATLSLDRDDRGEIESWARNQTKAIQDLLGRDTEAAGRSLLLLAARVSDDSKGDGKGACGVVRRFALASE